MKPVCAGAAGNDVGVKRLAESSAFLSPLIDSRL
jgi:hypothetical protein